MVNKWIVNAADGRHLALCDSAKEARATGREYARRGHAVLIFLATATGAILAYSSKDTAAANKV